MFTKACALRLNLAFGQRTRSEIRFPGVVPQATVKTGPWPRRAVRAIADQQVAVVDFQDRDVQGGLFEATKGIIPRSELTDSRVFPVCWLR